MISNMVLSAYVVDHISKSNFRIKNDSSCLLDNNVHSQRMHNQDPELTCYVMLNDESAINPILRPKNYRAI